MWRDILDDISRFCATNGMAETTFGRLAVNDGKLARRLRAGSSLRPATVDRIATFIYRYPKQKRKILGRRTRRDEKDCE